MSAMSGRCSAASATACCPSAASRAWLLASRAVQGAGGAIVAPTALALIATTFPEGPPRNRAMGVYSAMSVAGGAGGLYWLSRMTEHGTYAGGLLGPSLVTGAGLGLLFVPLSLVALAGVAEADSGAASGLLNAGR